MRMPTTVEQIQNFLKNEKQKLGVLSTVGPTGTPQSAFIYYAFDEDLNIYFITRTQSRKFLNIEKNPHVAFVVGTETPPQTLQIEGTASILERPEDFSFLFSDLVKIAVERHFVPPITQMTNSGDVFFMKITPNWVRLGNFEIRRKGELFEEIGATE